MDHRLPSTLTMMGRHLAQMSGRVGGGSLAEGVEWMGMTSSLPSSGACLANCAGPSLARESAATQGRLPPLWTPPPGRTPSLRPLAGLRQRCHRCRQHLRIAVPRAAARQPGGLGRAQQQALGERRTLGARPLGARQPLGIGRDRVGMRSRRALKKTACVMEPPKMEKGESSGLDHELVVPGSGLTPSGTGGPDSVKDAWKVLPDVWEVAASAYGDDVAILDPHFNPPTQFTFKELAESILDFGEGIRVFGMNKGETISLFSENSHRWLIADQGAMVAGVIDAVRGAKAPPQELAHIFCHSDSSAMVLENEELLEKLLPHLESKGSPNVKFAVVLKGDDVREEIRAKTPFPIHTYAEIIAAGHASRQALAVTNRADNSQAPSVRPDDVATLVYTSGTTGNPKGVMLTHENLLHQVKNLVDVIQPEQKRTLLSILPPWHMYERSAEYFFMSHGGRLVYSNVQNFKDDLTRYPPDYFVAVPLVFDVLYNGVQKRLASASATRQKIAAILMAISKKYQQSKRVWEGLAIAVSRQARNSVHSFGEWLVAGIVMMLLRPLNRLAQVLVYRKIRLALGITTVAISGGGSLAPHVDEFFQIIIGLPLLNGYGLTETSPVLTARRINANALGSVGPPVPFTEVKVVDPVTGESMPDGVKGLVKVKGPQVMKGYYKNPAGTIAIIDEDGWFDTGDLGWISPKSKNLASRNCGGMLVLEGRAKDTIVLSSGENVEPGPLEEAILKSNLISQVMLVGQDQRKIGALIVSNKEELHAAAVAHKLSQGDNSPPAENDYRELIRQELRKCVNSSKGFRTQDSVGPFVLIDEPFSIENGMLTATMKMKRDVISDKYADKIKALF
ncbi:hypothetical protein CBR_g38044 [Chara braunii]|uniref:AMP-dependent synthetase/ligase domain-containing protein n=1 Tax=Chara braunii TaxID=69332 RepID=A0A388K056_CHABU|nr:hypothetical protein CBR_g38044 [Chara braunii]|eukprot:GBG63422.1 hypothetical protein CBR_g38044 [Chara braunii]